MTSMTFDAAIESLSARNAALAAACREGARRLLNRSVSSLAASVADQRRELAKELAALAGLGLGREELDLEIDAGSPAAPSPTTEADALLRRIQEAEMADYELMTAISGAVLHLSAEAAERLATFAEQARKRSSWAQDHLELLGLGSGETRA